MIFQDAPELFKIAKIPKVDFPKPYHTDLVPGYWFSKFSFQPQFNAEDFESPAAPKKMPAAPKKKPEAPKKKRQHTDPDWFTTSESDMITLDSSGSAPSTPQAKTSSSSKCRTRWLLTEEEKKKLGPRIRDDGRSRPKRKTKKNKKKKKKNKNMKKKKIEGSMYEE